MSTLCLVHNTQRARAVETRCSCEFLIVILKIVSSQNTIISCVPTFWVTYKRDGNYVNGNVETRENCVFLLVDVLYIRFTYVGTHCSVFRHSFCKFEFHIVGARSENSLYFYTSVNWPLFSISIHFPLILQSRNLPTENLIFHSYCSSSCLLLRFALSSSISSHITLIVAFYVLLPSSLVRGKCRCQQIIL